MKSTEDGTCDETGDNNIQKHTKDNEQSGGSQINTDAMHGCSDNVVTGRNHGDDLSGKSSPLFSRATTFVGTTRYMSPERLDGQPYDFRADVWSLGLCIMASALGKHPISSCSYWSVLDCVKGNNSPMISKDDTRWSVEFKDFLSVCLKKDPSERPSCKDLLYHPFLSRTDAGDKQVIADILQHQESSDSKQKDYDAFMECISGTISPFNSSMRALLIGRNDWSVLANHFGTDEITIQCECEKLFASQND
mmetsp:Transcript_33674/g.49441  ORF Transcript_33674/g.49441 Transcript_33674/m.49441 type:complete len:250 (-) Transcript_33674:3051-3800(-)